MGRAFGSSSMMRKGGQHVVIVVSELPAAERELARVSAVVL